MNSHKHICVLIFFSIGLLCINAFAQSKALTNKTSADLMQALSSWINVSL